MEIKFWKIVDEKRAWVLLRVHRWLLVGPVFIPNFYGNNPWVLGGRPCPFIGWRSRYVGGGTRTGLLTFGPVALALVIAVGDHWE
jgi:hypothetical protein